MVTKNMMFLGVIHNAVCINTAFLLFLVSPGVDGPQLLYPLTR